MIARKKHYDIFWDNGSWVVIRDADLDPHGVRRNIAPYECQTRRDAEQIAREDREFINTETEEEKTRYNN